MSVKKRLLIVLAVIAVVMIIGSGRAQARFSELTAESTVAEPYLGAEIIISALDNEQFLPSVAYNPIHDEYLVVWHNTWGANRDIYAQRLNGRGELLSWFAVGPTAPLNPYPNDRAQPSVAYDYVNDRYLVVWAYDTSGNGSNWDIHGIFVNWNGPIQGLHQFNICDWPTQQWDPKVAYSPVEEEFMIVWWTDHTSVPDYISGRRMKASDGTFPTIGSDFTINDTTYLRVNPEVSYNLWRNEYLVVYDDTQDIFGSRFQGDGGPAGGEFGIATWPGAETQPSVAYCFLNDHYLVTWQNPQPDIYARFLYGNGALDGAPLHLNYTSIEEIKPKVACSQAGSQFLVTWQQQYSNLTGPYGIRGQFVNTDKTLGIDFQIMAPTAGVTAEFTNPVVGAGGGPNFLTAWEHDRAGTAYQDIHGRLISPYAIYLPLTLRN
jgi:hypothetical protein